MPATRFVALALLAALASPLRAQDAPKDDALDDLLKKLEAPAEPAAAPDSGAAEDAPAELEAKDKALDELLEKLGQTEETPAPGKPEPPKPPGAEGPADDPKAGEALGGKEKSLDEHLEELLGRRRKKPKGDQEGGDGGPLKDVVEQMRDVEERLGETDTGEQTRQKQQQIVKRLDQVIQQLRNSSGGGGRFVMRQVKQAGNTPGDQPGGPGAQGNTAQGVGPSRPERPTGEKALAGGKDAWGHLPPELRDVMENIAKEEYLPARAEMIRRYYMSVSRKGSARED